MRYAIEVLIPGDEFTERMGEMRAWLDRNRYQPRFFRYAQSGTVMVFRIDFETEGPALEFARVFEGRLLSPALV